MKQFYIVLFLVLSVIQANADKLVLLNNNIDSLRARVDYIQNAKKEIRVQYFSIDNDVISFTTLALLRDAASRGVKIKILVDSMHNSMKPETMAALIMALHPEVTANIEIKVYNPFNLFRMFRYTKRMHDKSLIIDNEALISGGRNIGNGYFGRYHKTKGSATLPIFEDSDVLILESPAINTATQYFDDLWGSKFVSDVALYNYSKDNLAPDYCRYNQSGEGQNTYQCEENQRHHKKQVQDEERKFHKFIAQYKNTQASEGYYPLDWKTASIEVDEIEFLHDDVKTQNSSLDKPEKNIAARLYSLIAGAQKRVLIVSPYLVITPEQEALFKNLKDKNVSVHIYTNSKASNDSAAAYVGYEKTRHIALNQGAKIFEYQGPDTLHAKMVLVDDVTLFIGSYNWDFRSQNLNREVGVIAKLPVSEDFSTNMVLYEKISRIFGNSCELNSSAEKCSPISNINYGDIDEEQVEKLMAMSKKREQSRAGFFRFFFLLIKEQL
ncbi:phosphatidylserine/phosphatidylglycerophosphate/cardiolipin synthase family protein [bacterium]|nr:phosphatidylserine/phosphatidylglycerophosphate/cardiolipin synthase family protein [bacterium]